MTKGRYYFVDDETPAYPGFHRLGSRDWLRPDERPEIGEWAGPHPFDKGLPPLVLPAPVLVGNARCVERGGIGGPDTPETDDATGLERWLPLGCYPAVPPAPTIDEPPVRIRICPDRATIAKIQALLWYDSAAAKTLAEEFVGPGSLGTLIIPPDGHRFSRSLVVVRGDTAYQFVDGTRNAMQLISQAYGTNFGGTSFGAITTTRIYWDYATEILSRFTGAGAAGCDTFCLVGHSYGAAASAVAASRLLIALPGRQVSLMTFGAPRAGDSRLIARLRDTWQMHIRRPTDPIPFLPPQPRVWALLIAPLYLLAFPFLAAWGRYESYEGRRVLADGFLRDELPEDAPDNTDLIGCVASIVNAEPLAGFTTHDMRLYANDMAAVCGMPLPFPPA